MVISAGTNVDAKVLRAAAGMWQLTLPRRRRARHGRSVAVDGRGGRRDGRSLVDAAARRPGAVVVDFHTGPRRRRNALHQYREDRPGPRTRRRRISRKVLVAGKAAQEAIAGCARGPARTRTRRIRRAPLLDGRWLSEPAHAAARRPRRRRRPVDTARADAVFRRPAARLRPPPPNRVRRRRRRRRRATRSTTFGTNCVHSFIESAVSDISAGFPVPTPITLPAPPFAAPPIPEGQTIIPPPRPPSTRARRRQVRSRPRTPCPPAQGVDTPPPSAADADLRAGANAVARRTARVDCSPKRNREEQRRRRRRRRTAADASRPHGMPIADPLLSGEPNSPSDAGLVSRFHP